MTLIFKLRATCKLKTKALKNTCAEVDIYILILWTHSFLNWFNIWKCAIKLTNIRYLNSPIILTNMLSFDSAMYFKKKLFRCVILLSSVFFFYKYHISDISTFLFNPFSTLFSKEKPFFSVGIVCKCYFLTFIVIYFFSECWFQGVERNSLPTVTSGFCWRLNWNEC